jgi:hypothetical protein
MLIANSIGFVIHGAAHMLSLIEALQDDIDY